MKDTHSLRNRCHDHIEGEARLTCYHQAPGEANETSHDVMQKEMKKWYDSEQ